MSTVPPRQRATLARRIAAGLPVWAAARASNLPEEDVGELMWENAFRELISTWAEIFDMDPEARKKRLLQLAHAVIEEKLAAGDAKTSLFVQREYRRNRDPVVSLAKGFVKTVECAKAERARQPSEPTQPTPTPAAMAEPEPTRTLDPDDTAMWRAAGQLRCDMFDRQVLRHAVTRRADLDRRLGPPDIVHEPEPQQEVQDSLFSSVQQEAETPPPEPSPHDLTDENEETDTAFAARASALFQETLSQAPPHLRAMLATFSQQELWALAGVADPDGPQSQSEAQPQAP